MTGLTTTNLTSLTKIYSGKVRDLYAIDDARMLMIATDRLSAFDVILAEPIPEKGKILTAISNFWFDKLKDVVPSHFTGERAEDVFYLTDRNRQPLLDDALLDELREVLVRTLDRTDS